MSGRRMRELSVVLGLVLMVMLGAIAVVWATQGGLTSGDAATPTRGRSASPPAVAASPTSATAAPVTPTASATPTGGQPTDSPPPTDPGTSPSPTESPAAPPSPSPTVSPGAPTRVVDFLDVGLDQADTGDDEPSRPRTFTFTAQGPGVIEAFVSDVSAGRVTICLAPGTPQQDPVQECQTFRGGALSTDIDAGEAQTWTVSLIGAQSGVSPSVDLRLAWPTDDPRVHIENFRFQGEAIENYNGFTLEVEPAADGQLGVSATFDDNGFGGAYPWLLTIEQVGGGPSQTFVDEGTGDSMQSGAPVIGERRYRVTLANREMVSEQRVLLSADIDWP